MSLWLQKVSSKSENLTSGCNTFKRCVYSYFFTFVAQKNKNAKIKCKDVLGFFFFFYQEKVDIQASHPISRKNCSFSNLHLRQTQKVSQST